MQSNVKSEEIEHGGDRQREEKGDQNIQGRWREGVKSLDANSVFFIPLSVCMSDRDQRWRNVT